MATLSDIRSEIEAVIQSDLLNASYLSTTLNTRINRAITSIAGGIMMPNLQLSPPLPDLYSSGTVSTSTSAAYKALPTTYQRNVFMIADDSDERIPPPPGGDYYSFMLFLNSISDKSLGESGSIYRVCIKGNNLYYQGIPTASEDLTVHFYRKPVAIALDAAVPDGIPDFLQVKLIKNYVIREFFADQIKEDFKSEQLRQSRIAWHDSEFYSAMQDLVSYIGDNEGEAVYYRGGNSSFQDLGVCD